MGMDQEHPRMVSCDHEDCEGTAKRDFQAEAPTKHTPGNWPMHSYAAGVSPDQRKEAYEASVKAGVPTYFDENGDAVFKSRAHRKKYCEAVGLYDRDAGYGDATPEGRLDGPGPRSDEQSLDF
jgi:hypothetical protein